MDAEQLIRSLKGRWYGSYGTARCPAHNDHNPSLAIRDSDNGKLLLYCHAGCDYKDIAGALRALFPSSDYFDTREHQQPIHQRAGKTASTAFIRSIWNASRPIIGSAAEVYLRGRGIRGALPASLRYHPDLHHPGGAHLPAMVGKVERDGVLAGLHRTYLKAGGHGKAAVTPAKAMLGPCRGGAVHLREGCQFLAVCEGIETGLSLSEGLSGDCAIWAALSTSGMRGLHLPAPNRFNGSLLVAADGDAPGQKAGYALAELASQNGWSVELISPTAGKDFNDLLLECNNGR